jgi:RecA/RadA recombinase
MDKLKKNSKLDSDIITKSKYYGKKDMSPTDVPMLNVALSGMLNVALSGSVEGGLSPGVTILAGPSKHFKTSFALKIASAYMKQHEDAVMLFYDSEFGSPQSYFEMFGIDMERVLHCPITNIEELKFDITNQLEEIKKDDKVIIVVDSLGNLASKKEVEDALNEKAVADMTRAKQLKSVFRIITPHLSMKDIPFIGIAHTYDTQEMFSKKVVSGGTGLYYSADDIWILGRRQNKEGTSIVGYDFVINVDKSRYVREKTNIPISVTWEGGIDAHSGLLDVALAGQFIVKPSNGWYSKVDQETGEVEEKKYRAKELTEEFWSDILASDDFKDFVEENFKINGKINVEVVDVDEIEV